MCKRWLTAWVMDRLRAAFNRLRRSRRAALIPFVMGGHPSLAALGPLLLALQDAGADAIEVGLPFSDPLADGPILQAAAAEALRGGATPERILRAVKAVRPRLRVPVLCLSYWNPILQFGAGGGPERFLRAARASGIDGVIVPDLPVEAGRPWHRAARRAGVASVFLAAPTSPPERLRLVARASEGFIYYVSIAGTTGVRRRLPTELLHGIRQMKLLTTKPVCVGFGISTPRQAAAVARVADGVIVGSALVQALGRAQRQAAVRRAAAFLRPFRWALR